MNASIRRIGLTAGITTWAAVAVAGMSVLMASTRTPDAAADPRAKWPAGLSVRPVETGPTLIVCLHPRCPCSDATLDSLISLLGTSTNTNAYVLFTVPDGATAEWTRTALVARAQKLQGLHIVMDVEGRQSAQLGARTSGQTFLYDAKGRLVFSGGLTPGRGESGASVGSGVIADALSDHPTPLTTVVGPVFGCSLVHPPLSEVVQ